MPLPPVEEDGTVADTPALEFTKVRSCVFLMRIRRLEAVFFNADPQVRSFVF